MSPASAGTKQQGNPLLLPSFRWLEACRKATVSSCCLSEAPVCTGQRKRWCIYGGYAAGIHRPSILSAHVWAVSRFCTSPTCCQAARYVPCTTQTRSGLAPVLPTKVACLVPGSPGTRSPQPHSWQVLIVQQHRQPGRAGATNDTICQHG